MTQEFHSAIDNLFASLPTTFSEEVFTDIVNDEHVKIERIISNGHTSPDTGWHDQENNEWVVVLKGEAKLTFKNDDDVHLVAGSHINIPANTKHKVSWTIPDTETIWLAVHYK